MAKEINIKNKKGFTLAEVLITLAIIGIIAALTVPTVMTNIQNAQNKTAWKKAFAMASQAYQQALDDNGTGFGNYSCGGPSTIKLNALMSHLNVVKICDGSPGGNCWATNGASYPDGSFPGAGCTGFNQNTQTNTGYAFITADGMRWIVYGTKPSLGGTCPLLLVDVNGAKGPDKLGLDVFQFTMLDKTLSPTGVPASCGWDANSQNYLLE